MRRLGCADANLSAVLRVSVNEAAEQLRARINTGAELPEGRRELHDLLDAALKKERLNTIEEKRGSR